MFAAQPSSSASLEPCGDPAHEDCGLRLILDRLGEKWTVMAVAELSAGPRRYRQIERALPGVTQRMLTLTLRRLERDGLVLRHVEATIPPSVTYTLSDRGVEFSRMAANLVAWSRQNRVGILTAQEAFDRRSAE